MKTKYIFLCIITTILLFSCPEPEDLGPAESPGPSPVEVHDPMPEFSSTTERELDSQENVEADFVGGLLRVIWDSVENAKSYDVYRQQKAPFTFTRSYSYSPQARACGLRGNRLSIIGSAPFQGSCTSDNRVFSAPSVFNLPAKACS